MLINILVHWSLYSIHKCAHAQSRALRPCYCIYALDTRFTLFVFFVRGNHNHAHSFTTLFQYRSAFPIEFRRTILLR